MREEEDSYLNPRLMKPGEQFTVCGNRYTFIGDTPLFRNPPLWLVSEDGAATAMLRDESWFAVAEEVQE